MIPPSLGVSLLSHCGAPIIGDDVAAVMELTYVYLWDTSLSNTKCFFSKSIKDLQPNIKESLKALVEL